MDNKFNTEEEFSNDQHDEAQDSGPKRRYNRKETMRKEPIRDRAQDTRRFEERDAQIRDNLAMTYRDLLYIDPKLIPEGKDACWIRDSLLGTPDYHSLDEAASRGWEAVTAEQLPSMASKFSHGGHMPHYIRKRELILHFRDKAYGQIEEKAKNNFNLQAMNQLPGQDHFMDDPSMPMKVFHNQRTRSN